MIILLVVTEFVHNGKVVLDIGSLKIENEDRYIRAISDEAGVIQPEQACDINLIEGIYEYRYDHIDWLRDDINHKNEQKKLIFMYPFIWKEYKNLRHNSMANVNYVEWNYLMEKQGYYIHPNIDIYFPKINDGLKLYAERVLNGRIFVD